jgi:Outer membrane protein beta-barrel domain
MIGHRVVLGIALSLLPSVAFAQFEVSVGGGVHFDRASDHDRVVTDGGSAMFAAKGEASALGIQLGYWRTPRFGFQLDLSRSSNESWAGSTPLPPPSFANRTVYLSARAATRTAPEKQVQLGVAAGPALMIYGGTGTNLRTRGTDIGGVVDVSGRLRIAHRLAFQLSLSNYLYISKYRSSSGPGGGPADIEHSVMRYDPLLLTGLVYTWR